MKVLSNSKEDFFKKRLKELSIKQRQAEQTVSISETGKSLGLKEVQAVGEGNYWEQERHKTETAGLKEKNRDMRHNRMLRGAYANRVFCYLIWYSIFVGFVIVFAGFSICGFSLPSSVLGFLVGSTAASAIGLVYAVTHGLFSK